MMSPPPVKKRITIETAHSNIDNSIYSALPSFWHRHLAIASKTMYAKYLLSKVYELSELKKSILSLSRAWYDLSEDEVFRGINTKLEKELLLLKKLLECFSARSPYSYTTYCTEDDLKTLIAMTLRSLRLSEDELAGSQEKIEALALKIVQDDTYNLILLTITHHYIRQCRGSISDIASPAGMKLLFLYCLSGTILSKKVRKMSLILSALPYDEMGSSRMTRVYRNHFKLWLADIDYQGRADDTDKDNFFDFIRQLCLSNLGRREPTPERAFKLQNTLTMLIKSYGISKTCDIVNDLQLRGLINLKSKLLLREQGELNILCRRYTSSQLPLFLSQLGDLAEDEILPLEILEKASAFYADADQLTQFILLTRKFFACNVRDISPEILNTNCIELAKVGYGNECVALIGLLQQLKEQTSFQCQILPFRLTIKQCFHFIQNNSNFNYTEISSAVMNHLPKFIDAGLQHEVKDYLIYYLIVKNVKVSSWLASRLKKLKESHESLSQINKNYEMHTARREFIKDYLLLYLIDPWAAQHDVQPYNTCPLALAIDAYICCLHSKYCQYNRVTVFKKSLPEIVAQENLIELWQGLIEIAHRIRQYNLAQHICQQDKDHWLTLVAEISLPELAKLSEHHIHDDELHQVTMLELLMLQPYSKYLKMCLNMGVDQFIKEKSKELAIFYKNRKADEYLETIIKASLVLRDGLHLLAPAMIERLRLITEQMKAMQEAICTPANTGDQAQGDDVLNRRQRP